jgi:hypothetical protein
MALTEGTELPAQDKELVTDPRELLLELGRLQGEVDHLKAQLAAKDERDATATRVAMEAAAKQQKRYRCRWLRTPQDWSCNVNGIFYRATDRKSRQLLRHGPIRSKSNPNQVLRGGTVEHIPADHVRVLVESGFVEQLEGHDEIDWTDPVVLGIDTRTPDPANQKEWEALSADDVAREGLMVG